MSDNKTIWDALKTPPREAMKGIEAGRLRGKTDISPMWRYEAMTEHFGPVGFGWKFSVINVQFHNGSDGQQACFVDIILHVKHGGEWSEGIPGNGGSMFVANEKNGVYTDDDAVKKATTDALSSAMKMLGVAAEVYAGRLSHDSKYTAPPPKPQAPAPPKSQAPAPPAPKPKPALTPEHPKWADAVHAVASGSYTVAVVKQKYALEGKNEVLFENAVQVAKNGPRK
jgi:hypothetical protein